MYSPEVVMNIPHQQIDIGAITIGMLIGTFLFGVASFQVVLYYIIYRDDKKTYKCLVALTWLLEIAVQILIVTTFYYYSITHRHALQVVANTELPPSLIIGTFLNRVLGSLVQAFFSYRIWLLSNKNILLTSLMMLMNFAALAMGIAFTIESFKTMTFETMRRLRILLSATVAMNAACDIVLTVSLLAILQIRRCNAARHNNVITQIMIYSLNTGLLTSTLALGSTVVLARTTRGLSIALYAVSVYCVSLFTTMNARVIFRRQMNEPIDPDDIDIPSIEADVTIPLSDDSSSESSDGSLPPSIITTDYPDQNWPNWNAGNIQKPKLSRSSGSLQTSSLPMFHSHGTHGPSTF